MVWPPERLSSSSYSSTSSCELRFLPPTVYKSPRHAMIEKYCENISGTSAPVSPASAFATCATVCKFFHRCVRVCKPFIRVFGFEPMPEVPYSMGYGGLRSKCEGKSNRMVDEKARVTECEKGYERDWEFYIWRLREPAYEGGATSISRDNDMWPKQYQ